MIALGPSRRLSLMMALALLPGVAIVDAGDELPLPLDIERLASLPLVPPVPGLPSRRRRPHDPEQLARAVNRRARRNAQRLAARGAGR